MGMACQICNHSERLEIDKQIVQGISHTKIAKQYGVSNQSVRSHAQNHLSRQLLKHNEIRERINSERILDEIEDILSKAKRILRDSVADGKKGRGMALNAIKEIRCTIEFLSRLAITLQSIKQEESNAENEVEDQARKENIGRLELCELNLLGDIQDKINGEIPWKRLLPDSFYSEEQDYINIKVNVEPDENIEHERIIIRPEIEGGATSVKASSLVDGFVDVPEQVEPMEPEALREFNEPDELEPVTMTRRAPISKIYYGPGMPKAAARREAKAIIRNTGKMPREKFLRDALT